MKQPAFRFFTPSEPKPKRPKHQSITVARREVMARLDEGTECPCCGQYCKLYKRKLNSDMARWLVWLVRTYESMHPRGWVCILDSVVRGGDYAKLVHWDLIEACSNSDPSKRTSGLWRPTQEGIDFVHNRTSVPARVHLYNNQVHGWSKRRTTIVDALGEKFDYQELMNA